MCRLGCKTSSYHPCRERMNLAAELFGKMAKDSSECFTERCHQSQGSGRGLGKAVQDGH